MPSILILGGGLQAISTARSLKEAGYIVGILNSKKDYANKSSALDFKVILNKDNLLDQVVNAISSYQVDVILPMSDSYTKFLSSNRNIIEKSGCKIAAPDLRALEIAGDKAKLMKLCKDYNFPHPITISSEEISNINFNNLPFPVLIKPNQSVGARGIVKINNPEELKEKLPYVQSQFGECHIQEFISGNLPYFNVMVYRNKEGKCLNNAILKIIRYYPLEGGSSSLSQTVEIPELVNLCMQVLDKINYVGFADFDILQNKKGEFKIIEINPRVPASLRGATISGINFPAIIVADLLEQEIPFFKYKPGKYLRYLGLDLMWLLSSKNRFKASPNWFDFFNKKTFYQEGGWKDFKPMISSLFSNFNKLEFKNGKIRKKQNI